MPFFVSLFWKWYQARSFKLDRNQWKDRIWAGEREVHFWFGHGHWCSIIEYESIDFKDHGQESIESRGQMELILIGRQANQEPREKRSVLSHSILVDTWLRRENCCTPIVPKICSNSALNICTNWMYFR